MLSSLPSARTNEESLDQVQQLLAEAQRKMSELQADVSLSSSLSQECTSDNDLVHWSMRRLVEERLRELNRTSEHVPELVTFPQQLQTQANNHLQTKARASLNQTLTSDKRFDGVGKSRPTKPAQSHAGKEQKLQNVTTNTKKVNPPKQAAAKDLVRNRVENEPKMTKQCIYQTLHVMSHSPESNANRNDANNSLVRFVPANGNATNTAIIEMTSSNNPVCVEEERRKRMIVQELPTLSIRRECAIQVGPSLQLPTPGQHIVRTCDANMAVRDFTHGQQPHCPCKHHRMLIDEQMNSQNIAPPQTRTSRKKSANRLRENLNLCERHGGQVHQWSQNSPELIQLVPEHRSMFREGESDRHKSPEVKEAVDAMVSKLENLEEQTTHVCSMLKNLNEKPKRRRSLGSGLTKRTSPERRICLPSCSYSARTSPARDHARNVSPKPRIISPPKIPAKKHSPKKQRPRKCLPMSRCRGKCSNCKFVPGNRMSRGNVKSVTSNKKVAPTVIIGHDLSAYMRLNDQDNPIIAIKRTTRNKDKSQPAIDNQQVSWSDNAVQTEPFVSQPFVSPPIDFRFSNNYLAPQYSSVSTNTDSPVQEVEQFRQSVSGPGVFETGNQMRYAPRRFSRMVSKLSVQQSSSVKYVQPVCKIHMVTCPKVIEETCHCHHDEKALQEEPQDSRIATPPVPTRRSLIPDTRNPIGSPSPSLEQKLSPPQVRPPVNDGPWPSLEKKLSPPQVRPPVNDEPLPSLEKKLSPPKVRPPVDDKPLDAHSSSSNLSDRAIIDVTTKPKSRPTKKNNSQHSSDVEQPKSSEELSFDSYHCKSPDEPAPHFNRSLMPDFSNPEEPIIWSNARPRVVSIKEQSHFKLHQPAEKQTSMSDLVTVKPTTSQGTQMDPGETEYASHDARRQNKDVDTQCDDEQSEKSSEETSMARILMCSNVVERTCVRKHQCREVESSDSTDESTDQPETVASLSEGEIRCWNMGPSLCRVHPCNVDCDQMTDSARWNFSRSCGSSGEISCQAGQQCCSIGEVPCSLSSGEIRRNPGEIVVLADCSDMDISDMNSSSNYSLTNIQVDLEFPAIYNKRK